MESFELIVIGGGIYGTTIADLASQRGIQTALFDSGEGSNPISSSSGDSRLFRETTVEDHQYVPLARASLRYFRNLDSYSSEKLFAETGFAFIAEPGALHQRHHSARNVFERACGIAETDGISHKVMCGTEFVDRFPNVKVDARSRVFMEPGAITLFPDRIKKSQNRRLQGNGVTMLRGRTILNADASGLGTLVTDDLGNTYRSEWTVVATGAGEFGLATEARVLPQPVKWFAVGSVEYPAVVATRLNSPLLFGFPPTQESETAKFVIENEAITRISSNASSRLSDLNDGIESSARDFLPCLGSEVKSDWCQYVMMPGSRIQVAEIAHQFLRINGCSGHGYKLAPGVAERIVQAIAAGDPHYALMR